jgi:hypothetical protein
MVKRKEMQAQEWHSTFRPQVLHRAAVKGAGIKWASATSGVEPREAFPGTR